MAERPIEVNWAVDDDCDVTLTVTLTVNGDTNLDRFIPHIKDELGMLAHDTFKKRWD